MAFNLNSILFKSDKYAKAKGSGLNSSEILRIEKMIYEYGIKESESYDHQIQKHLIEKISGIKFFIIYMWQKSRDDQDILNISHLVKE